MSHTSALLTLCVKELTVIARDRQAAALLFAMPALFVLLLSLALEGVYDDKVGTRLPVVFESEDGGEFARHIEESLRARGTLDFVERPAGMEDRELFRDGGVRAVIHIPAGFTERVRKILADGTSVDDASLEESRIAWQASPNLDASYRWLLEAQLGIACMELVQAELEQARAEAGNDLERLGNEYQKTAEALEQVAGQLRRALGQLEDMQNLVNRAPSEFEALGLAALAESAARTEARAALSTLEKPLDLRARALAFEKTPPPAGTSEPEVVYEPLVPRSEKPSPEAAELTRLIEENAGPPDWLARLRERSAASARGSVPGAEEADGGKLFLTRAGGARQELPTPLQQTVPGWSLFAMFFIVVPLAQGLHRERGEGTLRRMLTLGVSRPVLVLGKLLPYVLVGVTQFACMMAVGLYLVPLFSEQILTFGDNPGVLVPITLVCSFAATSYGLLVASWSRTPEQAAAFGATSVVILSLLGGVMVPHFVMPAFLQQAALASPLYWGHRAYLDVFLHGAGLLEVSLSLGVLLGFAVLCLALASRRIAR